MYIYIYIYISFLANKNNELILNSLESLNKRNIGNSVSPYDFSTIYILGIKL